MQTPRGAGKVGGLSHNCLGAADARKSTAGFHYARCSVVKHDASTLVVLSLFLVFVHAQHGSRARVWTLLKQRSSCSHISSCLSRVPCLQPHRPWTSEQQTSCGHKHTAPRSVTTDALFKNKLASEWQTVKLLCTGNVTVERTSAHLSKLQGPLDQENLPHVHAHLHITLLLSLS